MTNTPKADRFKEFMKSYQAFRMYSEGAKGVYSENVKNRLLARDIALKYASDNLGMKSTLEDAAVREGVQTQVIDKYFQAAISQSGAEVNNTMTTSGRAVIEDAPNKGLAEIVLGLRPCEIKGEDKHNEIASAHDKYQSMSVVIDMYKKDSDDDAVLEKHKKALKITLEYAKREIIKNAEKNPALKKNGDVLNTMYGAIVATLATSPNANLTFAGDLRNRAKEEFDGLATTESAKAGYARETLTYWFENGKPDKKLEVINALGAVKATAKEDESEELEEAA